ncbi:MAG: manganese efflux pump, partial [Pyramidobacter sp.]|nr:manganese efflux pump [Pyramidobacter sp.]
TSIDALSVGFAIAEYHWQAALVASLIIAAVTWLIFRVGLALGRMARTRLSGRAGVLGGVILIGIGAEILIRSFFS